jgi:hydroxypyruvate isomerase
VRLRLPVVTGALELSACIEWLFSEEPDLARRVDRARYAGLENVEFWTRRDKDLPALAAALARTGARLTSFMSEPTGRLVDPSTHDAFLGGIVDSAQAAEELGCRRLIVLAGDTLPGASLDAQRDAIVAALRAAAPLAAGHDVTLLLEPLNTRVDHAGYFLDSTLAGLEIVEAVGAANVKLLFDLYHAVVMGEEPEHVLAGRIDLVGHIHLADAPGRHERGTGRVDWARMVDWLRRSGYGGALGLEYLPSTNSERSLVHLRELLATAE